MPRKTVSSGEAAPSRAASAGRRPRGPTWIWRALYCALLLAALAIAAIEIAARWLEPPPLDAAAAHSTIVLDRNDRLLRAFTTADGRWRLPLEPSAVDQRYLAILMAFEDRRFRTHAGVDPMALVRASAQLVVSGRIVSGASTLTMQVARLLEGRHERHLAGKLRQMVRARQLERLLSKDEILALYLKLAPFGGNIEGVRAASLAYFGKEPRRLSVAEAALLVALPQAPETRRPDRFAARARAARDRVIERAAELGVISATEAEAARLQPVPTARLEFPKLAPHLSESELEQRPEVRTHRLTLDRDLQESMEQLVRDHARALGPRLSAAILVVDHHSGEIRAAVGSADYFDEGRRGAIDMTRALRSPGSTLKPFIYGLAFERGLAHPETLIEDRPVRFGSYAPKNFDSDFHGTISIRSALQQSLNVPAVKVLAEIGPHALVGRFEEARIASVLPDGAEPSLAIALGGLGLRLADLAGLYATLARGGEIVSLTHRSEARAQEAPASRLRRRLLSAAAAWQVADILAGSAPPEHAKRGEIAYKTGTSYGFRDAWAIGFDGRTTIAVWVGRPDGASTVTLTGRNAAAPILFDAFQRLGRSLVPLAPPPDGVLLARHGALPPPLRRFQTHEETEATAASPEPRVQFAFPLDRSEIELEEEDRTLTLKAEGGRLPLTWLVDGAPLAAPAHARQVTFAPSGRGFVKLSVIDAHGRADHVVVRIR